MKNPMLSFWLSVANQWASTGRGLWMAEAQRQQTAMLNQMTKQAIEFWTGGWAMPAQDRKRRR